MDKHLNKFGWFIDRFFLPALALLTIGKTAIRIVQNNWNSVELLRSLIIPILMLIFLLRSKPAKISKLNLKSLFGISISFGAFYLFSFEGRAEAITPLVFLVGLANVLFFFGFIIWSYVCLGSQLSVTPALRVLRTHGPFDLIRHPIYAAYTHLALTYFLLDPRMQNLIAVALVYGGLLLRANEEEKVLNYDEAYLSYKKKVKHAFFSPVVTAPIILMLCICAASSLLHKSPKSNFVKLTVQLAYPVTSIVPFIYDDWSSVFIGNQIYRRFTPESDRPIATAITNDVTYSCENGTPLDRSCEVAKIEFSVTPFHDCMGRQFSAADITKELEIILANKTWILPNHRFCKSVENNICLLSSNSVDLKRRLKNIYFRFGWSKQKADDKKIGSGSYCLEPIAINSGVISSGVLTPASSNTELPEIFFSTSNKKDQKFDIALYGSDDLITDGRRNIATQTPLGYYVVSNPNLVDVARPWNQKPSVEIIRRFFEQHKIIFSTSTTIGDLLPTGEAEKESDMNRRVTSRILNFALPDYLPSCVLLEQELNNNWKNGNILARAKCLNTSLLVENIVKRKMTDWDAFLTPLSPGAPGRNAVTYQYFSSLSNESWMGNESQPDHFYYLVGAGQSYVTVDSKIICGLSPNSMGLGDIFITDFKPCSH